MDIHLRIFIADWLLLQPHIWNGPNLHDSFWRLYMHKSDGAAIILESGRYEIKANQLYFIPAGVPFVCSCSDNIWQYYVHFDVIGLPTTVVRRLFSQPILVPSSQDFVAAIASLDPANDDTSFNLMLQSKLKSVIYGAFAHTWGMFSPEDINSAWAMVQAHEIVRPALDYIDTHLSEAISNRELARLCHMSEDYFIRRFRECVGKPPTQYIIERRVVQAAQQLLFTGKTLEQIAIDVGFPNQFYFSRIFSRHIGRPPATYRKSTLH